MNKEERRKALKNELELLDTEGYKEGYDTGYKIGFGDGKSKKIDERQIRYVFFGVLVGLVLGWFARAVYWEITFFG